MKTPREHYEQLLARHYTWMFGISFEDKVAEQAALIVEAGIREPGIAVDLGCGSGFQAVALAEIGADHVHAIDTNGTLLSELKGYAGDRPITTYQADLMTFSELVDGPVDTVACMGDTLTHLANKADVGNLLRMIAGTLTKGGRAILSWRDLSCPAEGLERFIPLRSADDRIMVCFLEDANESVIVHDLVHERRPEGWILQKSAYPKLKLARSWVRETLTEVGMTPYCERTICGTTVLAAVLGDL